MAFLSIYTPTYQRPTLLARCVASVEGQTFGDVQHLIVKDEVGIGIDGMFAAIPDNTLYLTGKYVYILQDDDVLASDDVLEVLQVFAREHHNPPVIICKNQKRGNVYPTYWESAPKEGHIDLGNYVVRRDIFRVHAKDFGHRYAGDFDFIRAVWLAGHPFAWCDLLLAKAQALGLGRPESEVMIYEG